MKKTIDEGAFVRAFDEYNRAENFSIEGRRALYQYLTDYEDEAGIQQELDVIAICCDFSEYSTATVCAYEYGYKFDKEQSEEEQTAAALAWLQDRTPVIEFDGGIIIQQF